MLRPIAWNQGLSSHDVGNGLYLLVTASVQDFAMDTTEHHEDSTSLSISCADCCHKDSATCSDCVVTFLCNREPDDAVVIDVTEARGLRLLQQVGLVPGIRFADRTADRTA